MAVRLARRTNLSETWDGTDGDVNQYTDCMLVCIMIDLYMRLE